MEYIFWFIFSYVLILTLYYFLCLRRTVRGEKTPTEANFLINLYNLDINLFSYRKFLIIVGLVTCFDISLVATVVMVVKETIFQILFGFVGIIPVVILSYMILGRYYRKKQTKDNKKELEKEKKYLKKIEKKDNKKEKKKEKKMERRRKKYVK